MLSTQRETVADRGVIRLARLRPTKPTSEPPLVLLHGYPENLQIWCEVAWKLAPEREVIAVDWPGMGYSEEWSGGTTPELLGDRIAELLDHWQIDVADIAAIDMGGQPALVFAANHPERIGRLIVMNSLVFGDLETSWEIRVLRKFGWNRYLLRKLPRTIFRRASRTFLPRGVRLSPPLRDDFWNAFKKPEVRKFISKMCAGYQGTLHKLPAFYERIGCPTLVLWGEHDKHFPPSHAERLHEAIADSELEILPRATHWMPWVEADVVTERMKSFLRQASLTI